jgi:hypothetical protein
MKSFFRDSSGKTKRITPEGEPLEETGAGGGFPGRGKDGQPAHIMIIVVKRRKLMGLAILTGKLCMP